jgi:hypothetical protein
MDANFESILNFFLKLFQTTREKVSDENEKKNIFKFEAIGMSKIKKI